MRCIHCGNKFTGGDICPTCGDNATLRAKAYNVSVRLYNKGLEQARGKDLSGAVDSLKRSILFDKTNISARNLLGLVYYEMGQMADALIQWIVSENISTDKNPAEEYLRVYGENIRNSEKMEDSVSLYNQALEYVKQKNDDLAIIRLKKALAINDRFIAALNLLSLCYLMRGRNNDALDIVNRVLRMDINNPIALSYYRQICPDKTRPTAKNTNDMRYATYYVPKYNNNKKVAKPLNPLIMFLIGTLCTVIVMAVLVIPSITEGYKYDYEAVSESYNQLKVQYDSLSKQAQETADSLTQQNNELLTQLNSLNAKELQDRVNSLTAIKTAYEAGNVTTAAQQLLALNTTGFDTNALNSCNSLKQQVLPAASQEYFNMGKASESQGKTNDAKGYYNNCLICALSDTQVKYDAMLRLGIIAQEAGDTANALSYYQKVVDNTPSAAAKRDAQKRYNEIVAATQQN